MNYNKSGLVILLAGVIFSFIYFFYVVVFIPPIQLAELAEEPNPGQIDNAQVQSRWVSSPAGIAKGRKVYQTYCASCHGPKGKGDGPAGGALKPPPRDLIEGDWQKGGSSIALYKTLNQGIAGTSMLSFSYLSKEDRWALVHYIRSITQNKPDDDPKKLEAYAKTAP